MVGFGRQADSGETTDRSIFGFAFKDVTDMTASSSSRRPVVHLFVGLHKTGSSAVRFVLDTHRDVFSQHGFHIPAATWTRYIDGAWNGGHNNLTWEVCGSRPTVPQCGSVADLVREIAARPDRQHIVLSEDLDIAGAEHVSMLKDIFGAFDVRVIVFLRNQLDWVHAMYAEDNKWLGATTLSEWCRAHVGIDPRLNFHDVCRLWADAFGRITIRCHEQIRTRIADAFLECCDAPEALRAALAQRGVPIVNPTPDEVSLTLIRHASAFATATGITGAYFNAVVSPAIVAARQTLSLPRTRATIDPETADVLVPLMRRSNRALCDAFAVTLGPEYLSPVAPDVEPDSGISDRLLEDMAKVVVSAACDVTTRSRARLRRLAGTNGPGDAFLDGADIVCSPWQPPPHRASPLDDLCATLLDEENDGLYLERDGATRAAYSQVSGSMRKLRDFSEQAWLDALLTLQATAGLNTVSWNNIREGQFAVECDGVALHLSARHAPTATGEIVVIERTSASWTTGPNTVETRN